MEQLFEESEKVNSSRQIGKEDQNLKYNQRGDAFTFFSVWYPPTGAQCSLKPGNRYQPRENSRRSLLFLV